MFLEGARVQLLRVNISYIIEEGRKKDEMRQIQHMTQWRIKCTLFFSYHFAVVVESENV
jgi:hypothetical protein